MFTNRIPWFILLLAWMAGATWWHVCRIKQLCVDGTPPAVSTPLPVSVPALLVADGNQFRFKAAGNFIFPQSGATADRRGVGSLLDSLTNYLKANPAKELVIIGYYAPREQNTTPFASLGLARADGIKQLFQQRGIAEDRFMLAGVKKDKLTFSAKGDSLYGGLALTFSAPNRMPPALPAITEPKPLSVLTEPVTEAELAKKELFTSVFEPIDLYFPLSEATYIKTGETAKFLSEAAAYLTTHQTKELVLTGYTDNSGPDAVNLQLARDRANAIKAQLRKAGINAVQIQVVARGEADPKADNSTLSGRKANRRVTAVVH